MLTANIKIGESGTFADTRNYGLVYLSSDKVVGAPVKDFEETSYPEQEGVNICPKTVDAPFDYKITFFVRPSDGLLGTANAKIKAFNNMLYTQVPGSDVKEFKRVWFYSEHKRHLISGLPRPMSEASTFWRDPSGQIGDVVVVEWLIRVNKPSECNFDYQQ